MKSLAVVGMRISCGGARIVRYFLFLYSWITGPEDSDWETE